MPPSDFPEFLRWSFPTYVSSDDTSLDARRLGEAVGVSFQAVYKWMHGGLVYPATLRRIIALANSPENVAELAKLDRSPPTIEQAALFLLR